MAVSFNGVDQYLAIAAPRSEFSGAGGLVMSAWLYAPTTIARRYVVSFSQHVAANANRFGFGIESVWGFCLIWPMFTRPDGGSSEDYGPIGWAYRQTFVMAIIGSRAAPDPAPHWLWYSHRYKDGRGVGSASGPIGPFPADSSAAAAIGALADGSANFLEGEIEDLRFYAINVAWPAGLEWPAVDRLGHNTLHSRGRDVRGRLLHPDLVFRWPLCGIGAVTEVDTKSGVVATGMNGASYSRLFLPRRRRNRGG